MALILPNDIEANTTADAVELQQNYDAIENFLNAEVVTRDGQVAMTAPLLLSGSPTATNHAATKSYVDTQVATQLSQTEADARYVNLTGDTLTGALNGITPTAAAHLTRKDYVDAQVATQLSQAEADARYVNLTGDTMSGGLVVGSDPGDTARPAGHALGVDGWMQIRRGVGTGSILQCYRGGANPGSVGESYIRFWQGGGSSDTSAGNITLQSGPTVNYGTSSDYRLKGDVANLTDVARFRQLRPVRFRWLADPDAGVFDGFLAHEVDPVVSGAVVGVKDGEEMQQLDPAKLVPLLVATVLQLLDRVDALEATASGSRGA